MSLISSIDPDSTKILFTGIVNSQQQKKEIKNSFVILNRVGDSVGNRILLSEDAIGSKIRYYLKNIFQNAKEQDFVMFYHTGPQTKEGNLVTHKKHSKDLDRESTINLKWLAELIKNCRARVSIVILDLCSYQNQEEDKNYQDNLQTIFAEQETSEKPDNNVNAFNRPLTRILFISKSSEEYSNYRSLIARAINTQLLQSREQELIRFSDIIHTVQDSIATQDSIQTFSILGDITNLSFKIPQKRKIEQEEDRCDSYRRIDLFDKDKYVYRKELFSDIKAKLLAVRNNYRESSIIELHGEGGIGKSAIAQEISEDKEIHYCYKGGVIWISLGESPKLEEKLAALADALGIHGSKDHNTAAILREMIAKKLKLKTCLLVIDDVWSIKDLEGFIFSDQTILFSSRNERIGREIGASIIAIPRFSQKESISLLENWGGSKVKEEFAEDQKARIVNKFSNLPLAIKVVGAYLRRSKDNYLSEVDLFQRLCANDSLAKCFARSMDNIEEQEGEMTKNLYLALGVFQTQEISFGAIYSIWEGLDSSLTVKKAKKLLQYFRDNALLEFVEVKRSQNREIMVSIHDLLRQFPRDNFKDLKERCEELSKENLDSVEKVIAENNLGLYKYSKEKFGSFFKLSTKYSQKSLVSLLIFLSALLMWGVFNSNSIRSLWSGKQKKQLKESRDFRTNEEKFFERFFEISKVWVKGNRKEIVSNYIQYVDLVKNTNKKLMFAPNWDKILSESSKAPPDENNKEGKIEDTKNSKFWSDKYIKINKNYLTNFYGLEISPESYFLGDKILASLSYLDSIKEIRIIMPTIHNSKQSFRGIKYPKGLKKLYIYMCDTNDSVHAKFSNLHKLYHGIGAENLLRALTKEICNTLEDLSISTCEGIDDITLNKITMAKTLKILKLHGWCINDAMLIKILSSLKILQELDLSDSNCIEAKKNISFAKNKYLKNLNIKFCNINDERLKNIEFPIQLEVLALGGKTLGQYGERIRGISDKGLQNISNLKNLRKLDLSYSPKITGTGFKYLQNLQQLEEIDISILDNLKLENLKFLKNLKKLKKICLSISKKEKKELQKQWPNIEFITKYR